MPILNRIEPDQLRARVERVRASRAVTETRSHLRSFDETMGRQSMELALMDYALDAPPEAARAHFVAAAGHLSRALAGREQPDPDDSRNPWEAEEFLNVIGAFGSPNDADRIEALRPWQLRNPPREDTEAIGGYLIALCPVLAGGEPDAVLARCERPDASRDLRRLLRPAARGLQAASVDDEDGWNEALAALAALAAAHAREVRSGDLQTLPAGLMCLRGMMLARLGAGRGLTARAASPFLPLDLLAEAE